MDRSIQIKINDTNVELSKKLVDLLYYEISGIVYKDNIELDLDVVIEIVATEVGIEEEDYSDFNSKLKTALGFNPKTD